MRCAVGTGEVLQLSPRVTSRGSVWRDFEGRDGIRPTYHGRCKCIAPRLADRRGGRARMLPSGRDQQREALQASLGKMRSRFGREGG